MDNWVDFSKDAKYWDIFHKDFELPELGKEICVQPTSEVTLDKIEFSGRRKKAIVHLGDGRYLCRGKIVGAYFAFGSGAIVIDCGILIRISLRWADEMADDKKVCFKIGEFVIIELTLAGDITDTWQSLITIPLYGKLSQVEKLDEDKNALATLEVSKVEPLTYASYYTGAKGAKSLDKDPEVCVCNGELRMLEERLGRVKKKKFWEFLKKVLLRK